MKAPLDPRQLPGASARPHDEDSDPQETREWLESLEAVVRDAGRARGRFLLKRLEEQAQHLGIVERIPP